MSQQQSPYSVSRPAVLNVRISQTDKDYIKQQCRKLSTVPGRPLSEADVIALALQAFRLSQVRKV